MAYVSSDCPLPQNGRMAPPQRCVDASNAAIALADRIAADGRLRVYNAMPRLASFRSYGPGVVVSAAIMTRQSELARGSVISAGTPTAETSTLLGRDDVNNAPTVVPLNWIPGVERVSQCAPRVPAGAAVLEEPRVVMPERLGHRVRGRAPAGPAGGRPGAVERSSGRTAGFPAWADSSVYLPAPNTGLLGWIQQNVWLVAGVVAVGLVAYTGKQGRY